ncbi:MAG: cytochrome c [Burkholderiales bacterium]|nr:cytochrome c [Burkholderiales bacterium]
MGRAAQWLLVALLAAALLVWGINFMPGDKGGSPLASAVPAGTLAARGAYLARAGNCAACHTARGGAAYAGGRPLATPFGTVYAGNLTPDADTGIGQWTPAHFWRALHHGRSRDGRLLYPAFPYTHYTRITRADSDAIFEYLRTVPAVRQANREHDLRWPYNTQAALAVWRALYFRAGTYEADTKRSEQWNRGAYLVQGLGHCGACHTARNMLGASPDMLDLSGGLIPMQNWYAPSLTARTEAGVHDWATEEVVQLLQAGTSPRGTVLGPMAEVVLHSTQHLETADVQAMAVYLKSLPATPGASDADPREVPRATGELSERGAKLYTKHCADCHGKRGEGVPGAYPPLAGNRTVLMPVTANLVQVVLYGGFPPATKLNPRPYGMPPFAVQMGDSDVAAVLSYIRGAWGNKAAPVSEFDVSRQRESSR